MGNTWTERNGIWLPPGFDLNAFLDWSGGNDVNEIPFDEQEQIALNPDEESIQDEHDMDVFPLAGYINDYYPAFGMEFILRNRG
jgi:hypothetical protein